MNIKNYPTLIRAAESITSAELFMAPELSTLAALDATLLATTNLLEFNYPNLGRSLSRSHIAKYGVDEHLADSICILAQALRRNLSAYYATIQESCHEQMTDDQILF